MIEMNILTITRPLKNVNFCLSSRKAIILTTGIPRVFRGLKFEPVDKSRSSGTQKLSKKERFAKVS